MMTTQGEPVSGPWNLPFLVPSDQGWMSDAECAALIGFGVVLRVSNPSNTRAVRALEVGCYKGRATSALLAGFDHVTVIDTFTGPQEQPPEEALRAAFEANMDRVCKTWVAGELRMLCGESRSVLPTLAGGPTFDLVLVDGDHRPEAVYDDLRLAWPLLEEGGYLFVDDLNWPGIQAGIAKWRPDVLGKGDLSLHLASRKLAYCRKVGGVPV